MSGDIVTVESMAARFVMTDDTARLSVPAPLDPSQRAVLSLSDGECAVVIGAPGTGKTTTLSEALAERVIDRGQTPAELIALAASRASATTLRDRLALRIGVPTPGPLARTVTSLAFQICGDEARRNRSEPPHLLTGPEQDRIIAELLHGHIEDDTGPSWPHHLGSAVRSLRGFRSELRELAARLLERGLRPADLRQLGRAHSREEWQATADFLDEYYAVLDTYRPGFVDAAELVVAAAAAVTEGADLGHLRTVFVDDLHEATPAALELLGAFARRGIAVIGFGDPDIAATTFRDAQASALGRFDSVVGVKATRFVLSTAHRHTPALRWLTCRVTERIGTAAAGAQRAAEPGRPAPLSDECDEVCAVHVPSASEQMALLARVLRERHLLQSIPFSDMVVIVRSGEQIPWVTRSLTAADVPTRTGVARRALRDDIAARQLTTLVGVIVGALPLTPEVATTLLRGPFGGLDPVSLRRLRLALRHEELAGGGARGADELVCEALESPARLVTIDSLFGRRARRLSETLAAGRHSAESGATVEELLWLVWQRSGLADQWGTQSFGTGVVADEANQHLDAVVALFTAARRFVERAPENPVSDFVIDVLAAELPEDTLAAHYASDAVLVCTPSSVIGAEFRVVAVAGMQEGVWPNRRLRGSLLHANDLDTLLEGRSLSSDDARAEVLSDELRMFALAVSRARECVIVLCTDSDEEQPSPFMTFAGDGARLDVQAHLTPLSLRGLVGHLRRELVATGSVDAARALARLAHEGVDGADPAQWYGVAQPSTLEPLVDLDDPAAQVRVSPSKLETFEKSPMVWFIDSITSSSGTLASGLGTLVHAVMEEASTSNRTDIASLWNGIEQRWSELHFDAPWCEERERRHARTLIAGLSEYLRDFRDSGGHVLSSEGSFQVTVGPALLVGTIDRVELTDEGTVVIVDLKTGKTGWSPAEVADHAQLGAYQLALDAGAIESAQNYPAGGAKLVFVSSGVRSRGYREVFREPFDEEERHRMVTRVINAAHGMAKERFVTVCDLDERDPGNSYRYRLHVVPAVSE